MFRPWGQVYWLLGRLAVSKWSFLGCLSPESRSLTCAVTLEGALDRPHLVQILDGDKIHESEERKALQKRKSEIQARLGNRYSTGEAYLMDSLDRIEEVREAALGASENVIIDISSMPKRWFFPLVRSMVNADYTRNVVAVYTSGTGYAKELAFNPESARSIPGFPTTDDRDSHEYAFVGVGYQAMSMLSLFNDERANRIQMLFPFPPGPPGMNRNWSFVENFERVIKQEGAARGLLEYVHVNALDVSQSFDALAGLTERGTRTSFLAPYGPKPMSLAMCLFASAADMHALPDVPVYYTQPKRYALNYTAGVATYDGRPNINAYALKLSGKALYRL